MSLYKITRPSCLFLFSNRFYIQIYHNYGRLMVMLPLYDYLHSRVSWYIDKYMWTAHHKTSRMSAHIIFSFLDYLERCLNNFKLIYCWAPYDIQKRSYEPRKVDKGAQNVIPEMEKNAFKVWILKYFYAESLQEMPDLFYIVDHRTNLKLRMLHIVKGMNIIIPWNPIFAENDLCKYFWS